MANNLSKTQIDKLGDRLREGDITEADLRLLDDYRRSFSAAYEIVVGAIRAELELEPTGRPAKSTTSIGEKLQRESIRLSQIQDIAGCRVIVPGIREQDVAVGNLRSLFQDSIVVDRRERPTNGYRAVHVIINQDDKLVEVQVRTTLQHGWAELSEKAADLIDSDIKYGGGDPRLVEALVKISALFARQEYGELRFAEVEEQASGLLSLRDVPADVDVMEQINTLRKIMSDWRKQLMSVKDEIMKILEEDDDLNKWR